MKERPLRAVLLRFLLFACLALVTAPSPAAFAGSYSLPFDATPTTRVTFPSQAYQVGGSSLSMAMGDFNGDGFRDVAVANRGIYSHGGYTGADVSILLGYGDGTLAPQIHLVTPHTPQSVVASDFNRDGKDDLAIASFGIGEVSVFISHGDGTFGQPAIYSRGTSGGSLKAGDFNKDGLVHLIATAGGESAAVWLGAGDGSFSQGTTIPGGDGIVAVADMNANGNQDIVFLTYQVFPDAPPGDVSVTFGHGDGSFASPIHVPIAPFAVAVADFDGDGLQDLTSMDFLTESLLVLRGSGDGTFAPWSTLPAVGYLAVAADFNGDSRPDLAVRYS